MHVEIGVARHFQFDIELRVAGGGGMEFDIGVVAAYFEIYAGIFNILFTARLDGIAEADLAAIAAPDLYVSYVRANVQQSAGNELASIRVGFFVFPVIRGAG